MRLSVLYACPACRVPLTSDGFTDVTPGKARPPRIGDLVICPDCTAVSVLSRGRHRDFLRLATDEDIRMAPDDFKAALERERQLR